MLDNDDILLQPTTHRKERLLSPLGYYLDAICHIFGISEYRLAQVIGVSKSYFSQLVRFDGEKEFYPSREVVLTMLKEIDRFAVEQRIELPDDWMQGMRSAARGDQTDWRSKLVLARLAEMAEASALTRGTGYVLPEVMTRKDIAHARKMLSRHARALDHIERRSRQDS